MLDVKGDLGDVLEEAGEFVGALTGRESKDDQLLKSERSAREAAEREAAAERRRADEVRGAANEQRGTDSMATVKAAAVVGIIAFLAGKLL